MEQDLTFYADLCKELRKLNIIERRTSELEKIISQGILPTNEFLDDVIEELIDVFFDKENDEKLDYTSAYIARFLLYDVLGIQNSRTPENGDYINYSIFGIDDDVESEKAYAKVARLEHLDKHIQQHPVS